MKSTSSNVAGLEFGYDITFDAGKMQIRADGCTPLTLDIGKLDAGSKAAIIAAARSASELKSIDEWTPGEVVVADRACMVRDIHGLPMAIFRGQRIDERSTIQQILAIKEPEPVRLLRYDAELETAKIMRDEVLTVGQRGLAQSQVVLKRAVAAMGGNG